MVEYCWQRSARVSGRTGAIRRHATPQIPRTAHVVARRLQSGIDIGGDGGQVRAGTDLACSRL